MINQSQRQGAHTPQGRVTAISAAPTPAARPTIDNARFFQQFFASTQPSSSSSSTSHPATGYSEAHGKYDQERQRWSSTAYKVPPVPRAKSGQLPLRAQTSIEINVLFCATYQPEGEAKPAKTQHIREGMAVDYSISPLALFDFAKSTLLTELTKWSRTFAWDLSDVTLRETATWQDVLKVDLSVPYFSNRFLKRKPGSKSDGSLMVVPPKLPIEFCLLLDEEQWLSAEKFVQDPIASSQSTTSVRPVTPDVVLKRKMPPSPEQLRSPVKPSLPKRQNISDSNTIPIVPFSELIEEGSAKSVQKEFKQLSLDQVKKGIAIGGQKAITRQRKEYTVSCQMINDIHFAKLCGDADDGSARIIDESKTYMGFITYEKNNYSLGKGTFKTATVATLTWASSPPLEGLSARTSSETAVALKRPYDDSYGTFKIHRFNFADEYRKVLIEGTLLGWASSLLHFAYDFIDDFMSRRPPSKDPFPIQVPRLRFVKAAIARSVRGTGPENSPNKAPKDPSSQSQTPGHAYLLEELLPANTPFIKYIQNADAVPLQTPDEDGYDTGIFLCFIQHLQYNLTHGQAFPSVSWSTHLRSTDYFTLGAGLLLTDPQVMTHPSLAKGSGSLFGEGNVQEAFKAFPAQHCCNRYCDWFNLEKLGENVIDSE
ncbi:hypothetical protein CVT26_006855 [Gymnopilus dilepis]|uniref:Alpha-type protein kinase domain-containing protein n=1 Tax=Gymnopilus dilepis TaxID=231916 RepID=A0A409VMS4_9AGAR|nr:hypothetical protein CVT26_006855 [Gymnopilus dilepis]